MWCDSFDADLLKVVPGAAETLAGTAGVKLETHSSPTDGKINCPSAWWTDEGLAAFFWTDPELAAPAGYITDDPVVECTFLEAVRDEWVHGQILCVNRRVVWRPPARLMEKLMFDLRGWTVLTDAEREDIRKSVRKSLSAAAARLTIAVRPVAGEPR
jgi:hypothetical protein